MTTKIVKEEDKEELKEELKEEQPNKKMDNKDSLLEASSIEPQKSLQNLSRKTQALS